MSNQTYRKNYYRHLFLVVVIKHVIFKIQHSKSLINSDFSGVTQSLLKIANLFSTLNKKQHCHVNG